MRRTEPDRSFVIAAHPHAPAVQTVIARKLVSVDHLARPTYSDDEVCALIDKAIYGSRGEVTALSATPHEIIPAPESIRPKRVA